MKQNHIIYIQQYLFPSTLFAGENPFFLGIDAQLVLVLLMFKSPLSKLRFLSYSCGTSTPFGAPGSCNKISNKSSTICSILLFKMGDSTNSSCNPINEEYSFNC